MKISTTKLYIPNNPTYQDATDYGFHCFIWDGRQLILVKTALLGVAIAHTNMIQFQ